MPELKPCPFCGSSDVIETLHMGKYTVTCTSCLSSSGGYDSELAAQIAWNNRTHEWKGYRNDTCLVCNTYTLVDTSRLCQKCCE